VCYNLLQREAERELLPMARALDLGVTAWTPLASGYLTGKYREPAAVAAGPRRLDDPIASRFVARTPKNAAIVEELAAVASEVGCSPAQAALNWLRQRRVIPIVGARSADQLAEDLDCLRFPLAAEHLQRLDQVSASPLGYPHDFLAAGMVKQHLFGGMFAAIDNHRLVGTGV
jgi:aryl-alcohol dehydrogenase-like predicted oxidoreductase